MKTKDSFSLSSNKVGQIPFFSTQIFLAMVVLIIAGYTPSVYSAIEIDDSVLNEFGSGTCTNFQQLSGGGAELTVVTVDGSDPVGNWSIPEEDEHTKIISEDTTSAIVKIGEEAGVYTLNAQSGADHITIVVGDSARIVSYIEELDEGEFNSDHDILVEDTIALAKHHNSTTLTPNRVRDSLKALDLVDNTNPLSDFNTDSKWNNYVNNTRQYRGFIYMRPVAIFNSEDEPICSALVTQEDHEGYTPPPANPFEMAALTGAHGCTNFEIPDFHPGVDTNFSPQVTLDTGTGEARLTWRHEMRIDPNAVGGETFRCMLNLANVDDIPWVWHEIDYTLDIFGESKIVFAGSDFPSHFAYVDRFKKDEHHQENLPQTLFIGNNIASGGSFHCESSDQIPTVIFGDFIGGNVVGSSGNSVDEEFGFFDVKLVLSYPGPNTLPAPVTVKISDLFSGKAMGGGADYDSIGSGTVVFNEGDGHGKTKDFRITINDDNEHEMFENIELGLDGVGCVNIGGFDIFNLVITDNSDEPPNSPPAPPSSAMATVVTSSFNQIVWDASAGANGYNVARKVEGETDFDDEFMTNLPLTPTSIVDVIAPENVFKEHMYKVKAFNDNGTSEDSDIISALPHTPIDVGTLYVSSFDTDEIFRYTTTGKFLDVFVDAANNDTLDRPIGMAFDDDGNLYVASNASNEILRFQAGSGSPFGVSGIPGDALFTDSNINSPFDVAFKGGKLYVSNSNTPYEIRRYDVTTGNDEGIFGEASQFDLVDEKFFNIKGLSFGPNGHLYVVTNIDGVFEFDEDGIFQGKFGDTDDNLTNAWDITFDSTSMYVCQRTKIHRYDLATQLEDPLSPFVSGMPLGVVDDPRTVEFGPDGNIYFASRINDLRIYAAASPTSSAGDPGQVVLIMDPSPTEGVFKTQGLIFGPSPDIPAGFTLAPLALTIDENGGSQPFTVVLNKQPTTNVVFSISSGPAGEVTVDKSTLTFTPSTWDMPETVTVTGINDDFDRDDMATITVSVDAANSDDEFDPLPDQMVNVTLTDEDTRGITVNVTDPTSGEDGDKATFTVRLDSEPTADVSLTSVSDDISEGEVTLGGTLTFTSVNWDQAQSVEVTGQPDGIVDGDVDYTVTVSATGGDYDGQSAPASLTNLDIDTPGVGPTVKDDGIDEETGVVDGSIKAVVDGMAVEEIEIDVLANDKDVNNAFDRPVTQFDAGSGGRVKFPKAGLQGATNVSKFVKFMTTQAASSYATVILFDVELHSGIDSGLSMTGGMLQARVSFLASPNIIKKVDIAEFADYADGNWHSAGFTYETGALKVYFDGEQVGDTITITGGPGIRSNYNHVLGKRIIGTGRHFTGEMYDFVLYSKALTDLQVKEYHQGSVPGIPELELWAKMNEASYLDGSGMIDNTALKDSSIHGRDSFEIIAAPIEVTVEELGEVDPTTISATHGSDGMTTVENGKVNYTPSNPGAIGVLDTFTYTVRDTDNNESASATVGVRINAKPGAKDIGNVSVVDQGSVTIDLLANPAAPDISDPENKLARNVAHFDGNAAISWGNLNLAGKDSVSKFIRFKTTDTDCALFDYENNGQFDSGVGMFSGGSLKARVGLNNATPSTIDVEIAPGSVARDAQWHSAGFTLGPHPEEGTTPITKADLRVYFDGEQIGPVNTVTRVDSSKPITIRANTVSTIGRRIIPSANSRYFVGQMYDFVVYNGVLDDDDVKAYHAGQVPTAAEKNLILWGKMNEDGYSRGLADASGNGNNGTSYGATSGAGTPDRYVINVINPPMFGEVGNNWDGTITYTHKGPGTDADTFTYTVEDDCGTESEPATITIDVNP